MSLLPSIFDESISDSERDILQMAVSFLQKNLIIRILMCLIDNLFMKTRQLHSYMLCDNDFKISMSYTKAEKQPGAICLYFRVIKIMTAFLMGLSAKEAGYGNKKSKSNATCRKTG